MSKRTLIIALAAVFILTSMAAANGLNLNGLGTRAQAMGGAVVGCADAFRGGLGIGTPSELGTSWNGADFADFSEGTVYEWSSKVGIISFSPLLAVRLNNIISLGAAINVDYGTFNLKKWAGNSSFPSSPPVDLGQ